MKVLIIGGNGFVGKNTASQISSNFEVLNFSKSNGLDLLDLNLTCEFLFKNKPNIIINCAAVVGSLNYVTQIAADIFDVNTRMLLNLYKSIQLTIPNSTLINPIANCAYPGNITEYSEELLWNGKVHQSVIAYGSARRLIDVLSDCYRMQYGLKTISLIVPNMYGPYDSTDPNKAHALNALVSKIVKAKKNGIENIEVWGSGIAIREWLYAPDFGKIVNFIINNLDSGLFSEPFNIAQNFGLSISDLLTIILKESHFNGRIDWNKNMPDGAPRKVMNDNRFKRIMPSFKFTSLNDGLKETIKYYESVYPY